MRPGLTHLAICAGMLVAVLTAALLLHIWVASKLATQQALVDDRDMRIAALARTVAEVQALRAQRERLQKRVDEIDAMDTAQRTIADSWRVAVVRAELHDVHIGSYVEVDHRAHITGWYRHAAAFAAFVRDIEEHARRFEHVDVAYTKSILCPHAAGALCMEFRVEARVLDGAPLAR